MQSGLYLYSTQDRRMSHKIDCQRGPTPGREAWFRTWCWQVTGSRSRLPSGTLPRQSRSASGTYRLLPTAEPCRPGLPRNRLSLVWARSCRCLSASRCTTFPVPRQPQPRIDFPMGQHHRIFRVRHHHGRLSADRTRQCVLSGVLIGRSRSAAFIGPRYNQIDRLRPDQFSNQSTRMDRFDEGLLCTRFGRHGCSSTEEPHAPAGTYTLGYRSWARSLN